MAPLKNGYGCNMNGQPSHIEPKFIGVRGLSDVKSDFVLVLESEPNVASLSTEPQSDKELDKRTCKSTLMART